jgi:hypothetical protein
LYLAVFTRQVFLKYTVQVYRCTGVQVVRGYGCHSEQPVHLYTCHSYTCHRTRVLNDRHKTYNETLTVDRPGP